MTKFTREESEEAYRRWVEVATQHSQNRSFAAIAAQLHISLAAAKDYADRVYRKLDVHTREEALRKLNTSFRKFAHLFFKRPASRARSAPSDPACARSGD
ncbi:hypothetical protein [Variovorax sp. dw_954]|uniref:hypothetical protein n=1 Tax=Variovorax sp. dw_954 TaxID=2720078 RepID=UPI001BD47DBA|nr:hypothetical protein [Variovorax sp. dw_954]